jgi:hypothetical protein
MQRKELKAVVSSHPSAKVQLQPAQAGGSAQLLLSYPCGRAPELTHMLLWLYADSDKLHPVQTWQV